MGPPARLICWGGEDLDNGSTKRAHALLRIGTLTSLFATPSPMKTWLFGGRTHRYASPSIMYLSGTACAAQASPAQKTLLLDSFVEWTGYTRKYAIELLNHGEYGQETIQRRRLPQYRPAVQQALFLAWKATHYVCAKRLLPSLPSLVAVLEGQGLSWLHGISMQQRRQLSTPDHVFCSM